MNRRRFVEGVTALAAALAGCSSAAEDGDRGLRIIKELWWTEENLIVAEAWIANTAERKRSGVVRASIDLSDGTTLADEQQITVGTVQAPTPNLTFVLEPPDGVELPEEPDGTVAVVEEWVAGRTIGDGTDN